MSGSGCLTFSDELVFVICSQGLKELRQITGPKKGIYFIDFFFKVWFVSLTETSGNKKLFYASFLLLASVLQDGVDAFFFGIGNKATGIHHNNISLPFVNDFLAIGFQLTNQDLGVIGVFAATQCHNINSLGMKGFCSHRGQKYNPRCTSSIVLHKILSLSVKPLWAVRIIELI